MNMLSNALDDLSDDAVLRLYVNGDNQAARELTLRLAPGVLSLAKRLLNDLTEAEDVTQEAMMRLWKMAPDWRSGEAKPSTWLYRVTSNLCMDRLRRRRSVGLDEIAEPKDTTATVVQTMQQNERAKALTAALDQLPERQRTAVVMRHIEEFANPEIAEILNISVDAVESLTARGKRALAALLLGQKEELGLE